MRLAGIMKNDVVNGEGVCVSVWVQGCHFHCPGCHNPQTWDFNGGTEYELAQVIAKVDEAIAVNGIQRNFSILGGEPLCDENIEDVAELLQHVKTHYPNIHTFVWTGYELSENTNPVMARVLSYTDTLITGRYIESQRDITLPLRGSRNQRVLKRGFDF